MDPLFSLRFVSGLLIAVGVFILWRELSATTSSDQFLLEKQVIMGFLLVLFGGYGLFGGLSWELVQRRIFGLMLTILGFMIGFVFYPEDGTALAGGAFYRLWTVFGVAMFFTGLYYVFS